MTKNKSPRIKHSALFVILSCFVLVTFACNAAPTTITVDTPIPTGVPTYTATLTLLPTATIQPTPTWTPTGQASTTAIQCVVVPDNLVGWWTGNGDAQDVLSKNNGALNGGVSFKTGKVNQAFYFDGNHSSVDIPRSASLDVGKQVSVEFWINPSKDNQMNTCCQGLVGTDFYLIEFSGGHTGNIGVNFVVNTGAGYIHTSDKYNTGYKIPSDEWTFVVGTFDHDVLRLYINGEEKVEQNHKGNIMPMFPTSFLSLGSEDGRTECTNCPGTRYFRGMIDEVSIYNRALNASEIQSIYLAGEVGKCELQK
jgi:hypothetical protein